MDTTKDTAHPAHPSTPDDTVEAHYTGLERLECALCYEGLVYIGHLVTTEEGEEIEVVVSVPCRRCASTPRRITEVMTKPRIVTWWR